MRSRSILMLVSLTALSNLGMCCLGPNGRARAWSRNRISSCQQLPSTPMGNEQLPACPTGTRCIASVYGNPRYLHGTTYCLDSMNRRQGRYVQWSSGKLYALGFYRDNQTDGRWRTYQNGVLHTEHHYKMGRYEGRSRTYNNQRLVHEVSYKAGKRHGVERSYSSDGKLISETSYNNNTLHGRMRRYRASGLLEAEHNYVLGRLEGPWREVQQQLLIVGRYRRGLPHGEFRVSTLAGKQIARFSMNDGDGIWLSYYADGTLRERRGMKVGYPHGRYERYWENGKLAERGDHLRGQREGRWSAYDYRGQLVQVRTYLAGREVSPTELLPIAREQQQKQHRQQKQQVPKLQKDKSRAQPALLQVSAR